MRISLRLKLALISLLLLAIPYTGLRLSSIIKTNLIASREEALMFSARAVASALSGREGLFDQERFHSLNRNRDLYLYRLTNPMRLNGKTDDWERHMENSAFFGRDHIISGANQCDMAGSGFTHLLGQRGNYLYALFIVRDDTIVYRQQNSLSLTRSDHLVITIEKEKKQRDVYIVAPYQPGWVNGFLMTNYEGQLVPRQAENRIQGVWQPNDKGYVIELRIPLKLLGKKLAFAIGDVDDPISRKISCVISTASTDQPGDIGWLLSQSHVLEDILVSLNRPHSRIQIVDSNKHIRASYGSLKSPLPEDASQSAPRFSLYHLLTPLFKLFLEPLSNDFPDMPPQPTVRDLQGVDEAFSGKSSITSYRLADGDVEVMAAVTPLFEKDEVIGAVVVEQTTNSILALKNRVIEESFALAVTVLVFGGFGLFLFAFRISSRIRRLRDHAAGSVGSNGQIRQIPPASRTQDEIGDLSRVLHSILTQLKSQEQYHEKMADNLEHEMRTPLAGASASLKNLAQELQSGPRQTQDYVNWALRDIKRMEDLLTAIRDATSLTHALDRGFKEQFNLSEALPMWLEHGWKRAFADTSFEADIPEKDIFIHGDPDRIRQVLDKLIENGVAFREKGSAISLRLFSEKSNAVITVFNQGEHIPPKMLEEIFNSMISARQTPDQRPHLGLGLFIVRTIVKHHGGNVYAENIEGEKKGVRFVIRLPLLQQTS